MHVTIIDSIYLSRIRKYITGYQNRACGGCVGVVWDVYGWFGWASAGFGRAPGGSRGLPGAANVKLT